MTKLTSAMVIEAALTRTLVADPDLAPFSANLEVLVDCLNEEARLTPEAVHSVAAQLASGMRNRMEIDHWVARYPEIHEERIEQPIFLTGLPRSGTTYFQYLFDPEPTMRMLRYWEGDRACPPSGFAPETIENRVRHCAEKKAARLADPTGAKIAQIHLSDADGPEECLELIDQTFVNAGYYWPFRIPSYFSACLERDRLLPAYEHHKLALQLLQWRTEPRRWVLKWPCHLIALDEILTVHPDARFVVTHRDPVQALASNCSLTTLLRRSSSNEVDAPEVGRQMKEMLLVYLRRLMDFDARHGERMAHVAYRTAVERPEVAMAQALEVLGVETTPGFEEAIRSWRQDNPPGKRGRHEYALADYGLDAGELAEEFAFYTQRFDIPSEQAAAA